MQAWTKVSILVAAVVIVGGMAALGNIAESSRYVEYSAHITSGPMETVTYDDITYHPVDPDRVFYYVQWDITNHADREVTIPIGEGMCVVYDGLLYGPSKELGAPSSPGSRYLEDGKSCHLIIEYLLPRSVADPGADPVSFVWTADIGYNLRHV